MGASRAIIIVLLALCLFAASPVVGDPDLYDYDAPASVLSELAITQDEVVDFNGDGNPDNALGTLIALLEQMPGGPADVNQQIGDAIASGRLLVGAAWPTFETGVGDTDRVLAHFFELVDSDDDPATTNAFYVDRGSFDPLLPRHVLSSGLVEAGQLEGAGTSFPLSAPFYNALLFVHLRDVRIDARVAEDANGIVVTEGVLSGVLPAVELITALNREYRELCPCLGLREAEELFLASVNTEEGRIDLRCDPEVELSACDGSESPCSSISLMCSLLGVLSNIFDVDTDEDGINDGLSATFTFSMIGTRLLGPSGPPDCNQNGVADAEDIASGASSDKNSNGLPDECEPAVRVAHFIRGDSNGDGNVDISDGISTLSFLFLGESEPGCLEAADSDSSNSLDITDAIYLFSFLFLGGPPPAQPFTECGLGSGRLSCGSYDPCRGEVWPLIADSYLVTSDLEPLLPGVSPPLQDWLDEVFSDPVVFLLTLMATSSSGEGYLDEEPWNQIFECPAGTDPDGNCSGNLTLTPIGQSVAAILEAELDEALAQIPGNEGHSFQDAFSSGAEVFENATGFSLAGLLEITQDPDAGGLLGDDNSLSLGQITWRWDGGERTFLLRDGFFSGGSNIEMRLEYSGEIDGYVLIVSPFVVDLSYPELVMRVLETVVLPEFLGSEIDSLEDLFGFLVSCESMTQALDNEGLGVVSSAVEASCEALQASAVTAIESRLDSLNRDFAYEYLLATPPAYPCGLEVELTLDEEVVQQIGSPDAPDRCRWIIEYRSVDGGDDIPLDGSWWGERL